MSRDQQIRVGFVINNRGASLLPFPERRDPANAMSLMRYGWIADCVNRFADTPLRYELYRRRRTYDAVIFLKSMGKTCSERMAALQGKGTQALFDANVNYYEVSGTFYYHGMEPTPEQVREAMDMTTKADAVIADSEFLAGLCRCHNPTVRWIPDNVNMALVPPWRPSEKHDGKLRLLWSGQAVKLFELLAIEDVLRKYAAHLELILVTNSFTELDRWFPGYKERFLNLLKNLSHTVLPFISIEQLFHLYANGGIFIAPRYLDNSYNAGHTEWKITLAMACGRVALCSPLPSYVRVAELSRGAGIRICRSSSDWELALDRMLAGEIDFPAEEQAARGVVQTHFSTAAIALKHAAFVRQVLENSGG